MNARSVFGVAVVLVVLLLLSKSVYIVSEWERGVLLRFGEEVASDIQPGMHFKLPFVDQIKKFDTRVLTLDAPTKRYLTVDKKPLEVDSYAAWRIGDVGKFYRATSGDEGRAITLLGARIDNGLRDQFGRRTQHEVISGERDALMHELVDQLDERTMQEFGIHLLDIRVKGIELPPDVSTSVYERMVAERAKEAQDHRSRGNELAEGIRADADRQKAIIEAEAFREAERTRGEGDAVAGQIYAEAYGRDADFYRFYRSMQAYTATFAGKDDLLVIDSQSQFLRFLNDATPSGGQPQAAGGQRGR